MKLKCKIKDKEYNIVQGAHFSDEYNETLDSGTIIIDHIEQIPDLKPYDDVYIYEANEQFEGYKYKKIIKQYDEQGNSNFTISHNNNSITFKISPEFKNLLNNVENVKSRLVIILKIKIFNADTYLQETFANHIEEFTFEGNKLIPSKNNCIFVSKIRFLNNSVTFLYSALNDSYTIDRIKNFYNIHNNLEFNKLTILESFVQNFYYLYYDFSETRTGFYKHLLVDQFTEERLNPIENIFKYKIELFSETKRLETIILPNKSITEPLNIDKKISIWEYLKSYVEEYSPKIKLNIGYVGPLTFNGDNTYILWDYVPKYSLDPELKNIFEDVFSPDFSLNLPNLRDVLNRLMQVKDMIPYVKDDVIYGLNITERRGIFDITQNNITSITSTLTSDNFCNNLKTTYSNALSNEGSSHTIEHIGFRYSDDSLLTLNNLRLETRYPIYKINRILMCYYKHITVLGEDGEKQCVFLCKQDITPFVQLEASRNLLSQDWNALRSKLTDGMIPSIDILELASYKLMTVGYSIGSNYITGWGQRYEEIEMQPGQSTPYWWKFSKTYIQNILYFCDKRFPLGVDNKYTLNYGNSYYFYSQGNDYNILDSNNIISAESSDQIAQKLKSLFFEIDYTAFYNGSVVHSKDQIMDDGITVNDNSSSSLTILEQEGIYQKSKANRFGNKVYNISMRYNGSDYLTVNRLGYVYQENIKYDNLEHLGEDDIIIYHQDYSIFDNYILASYTGSKSAVLKNYFHSVFAKHRTWNIMPYGESVARAENERIILLLSKNNVFYENNLGNIEFLNFKSDIPILNFFNFFASSNISSFKGQKVNNSSFAAITIPDPTDENKRLMFMSDFNCFVSGNSLCLNAKMNDNFSSGVYIKNLNPNPALTFMVFSTEDVKDDYSGSLQSYHVMVDDIETGFIKKMGFIFGKIVDEERNIWISSGNPISAQDSISSLYQNSIFKLPQLSLSYGNNYFNSLQIAEKDKIFKKHFYDVISFEKDINKDNKEVIDMTLQIEAFSENEDIIISPWLLKLSDFYGKYNKIFENYYVEDYQSYNNVYSLTLENDIGKLYDINIPGDLRKMAFYPYLQIKIKNSYLSHLSGANVKFKESDYLVFAYEFTENKYLRENFSGWTNKKSYFYVTDLHFATSSQGRISYIDVTCVPQYVEGKINIFGRWTKQEKGGPKGQPFNIRFNLVVNNFNNPETQDGCNLYRAYSTQNIDDSNYIVVDNGESFIDLKCPYSLTNYGDFAGDFVDNVWYTKNNFLKTQTKDFVVNNNIPIYYPYPQNMFIGVYEHKIDKNFIYNSYKNLESLSIIKDAKVNNILFLDQNEQGIPYIKLNLKDNSLSLVNQAKYKSIAFWYYENPDSLSNYYKMENMNNFSIYTASQDVEAQQDETQQKWVATVTVLYNDPQQTGYAFSAKEISSIKHVNIDINATSIKIETLHYLPNNAGFEFTVSSSSTFNNVSYRVTYNMGEERLTNGAYHFVLGLNITEEDWANGEIKIYYSTLKNKSLNIYDLYNNISGKLYNYNKTSSQNLIVPEQNLSIGEPIGVVERLETPIVEKSGNILSWSAITGANKYNIFKNNSLIAETNSTTFNVSDYLTDIYNLENTKTENNSFLATTIFNVQAINGSSLINNSNLSESIEFNTLGLTIKNNLDDYTWEEIRTISDFIEALNNSKQMILDFLSNALNIAIGDTKKAIVVRGSEEVEYNFRLIDILHDIDNQGNKIGMTFEMVEGLHISIFGWPIDTSNMSNGNIKYEDGVHRYGYPYSTLKTFIEGEGDVGLNGGIILKDPANGESLNTSQQTLFKTPVKKCLVATKNIFSESYELVNHISQNGLWLASKMEILGEDISKNISNVDEIEGSEGTQYLYYQDPRIYGARNFAGVIGRNYNCWLRTISPYSVSVENHYQNNNVNKKYYLMVKPFAALQYPIDKQESTENEDMSIALYFCI